MVTGFACARQRVALASMTLGLLVAGAAPDLSGEISARKGKHAKAENGSSRLIQSFQNSNGIAIPDSQKATLYPSSIEVSGFQTDVEDVAVTLHRFSHTAPGDVDMLLVGPTGRTAIIVSDAGGLNVATNVTFTLDDQALNSLPATFTNGTFKPTNNPQDADIFPAPAPTLLTDNEELATFNGTDPNGTWSLYIVDNEAGNSGVLNGGWSLLITSENGDPLAEPDKFRVKAGKSFNGDAPGVLENDSDPDGDPLTAELAGSPRKGKVSLLPDGSFTYKAKKKAKGKDSFSYLARDPDGDDDLATVDVKIKGKKKRRGRH